MLLEPLSDPARETTSREWQDLVSDATARPSLLRRWVLHPFLLSVYPILALYSDNVYEANPKDLIAPISLVVFVAGLLWGIVTLVLRDARKAALLASIAVICFFGWVRVIDLANRFVFYASTFWVPYHGSIPPYPVFTIWALLWIWAAGLLIWKVKDVSLLTSILNTFSLILLVMPVSHILFARPPIHLDPASAPRNATPLAQVDPQQAERPDIYYIVLDSYARTDVMRALFDFDNRPFIESLERKGFYVPKHSIANYAQTRLCLSSSLNAKYLDEMVSGLRNDQTNLGSFIGQSDFLATLRPLGYRFAAFSSGFQETEHQEAEIYLTPNKSLLTGFQRLLISTTPCGTLLPIPPAFDRYEHIRERILYTLKHLPEVADDPSPTFTLAHFLCPHPPFLFGEEGQDVVNRDHEYYPGDFEKFVGITTKKSVYYRGYREQAMYITKEIEKTIDQILAKSKMPPIIILQADHGSGMNLNMISVKDTDQPERMMILNAYYFPNRKYDGLYDTISPVNSFRVLLNTYFGAKLEMLPDRSFFSTWLDPYDFHEVTSEVAGRDYPARSKSTLNEAE